MREDRKNQRTEVDLKKREEESKAEPKPKN